MEKEALAQAPAVQAEAEARTAQGHEVALVHEAPPESIHQAEAAEASATALVTLVGSAAPELLGAA